MHTLPELTITKYKGYNIYDLIAYTGGFLVLYNIIEIIYTYFGGLAEFELQKKYLIGLLERAEIDLINSKVEWEKSLIKLRECNLSTLDQLYEETYHKLYIDSHNYLL